MLGPWYVGDSPLADIVVSVARDGCSLELEDYASAQVVLCTPTGATVPWGVAATIDTDADTVVIPAPPSSPFASPGEYQLFIRLTDASGLTETFLAGTIQILALGSRPVAADVAEYLGDNNSWTDEEVQAALDAESAAQRAVCRVRGVYPADLREALLRRVARNLAMRRLPLAMPQGDAAAGGAVLPGRDPEVRRLEAPYRRLTVA